MIAHLTDLHLTLPGERPRGVAVNDRFQQVLADIAAMNPSSLVITGDICVDMGNEEIYRWCFESLEASGLHYEILPGNHDDPGLMKKVFGNRLQTAGDSNGRAHRSLTLEEERVILFDVWDGEVRKEDLLWLETALEALPAQELLLFMHYPPVGLPVAHMEEHYPLRGREAVETLISGSAQKVYLFCGHYHGELSLQGEGFALYLTPSIYFQIEPLVDAFTVEHTPPAWRFIERYGGKIATGVRYGGE